MVKPILQYRQPKQKLASNVDIAMTTQLVREAQLQQKRRFGRRNPKWKAAGKFWGLAVNHVGLATATSSKWV